MQDNVLYVYMVSEPHTLVEGYPKAVKDVLGLEGPIDAAFVCQDQHIAHVIKGDLSDRPFFGKDPPFLHCSRED